MTGLALNRLDRREGLVLVQAVAGNAALPDEIMTEVFESDRVGKKDVAITPRLRRVELRAGEGSRLWF